jgi:hypothetical protein
MSGAQFGIDESKSMGVWGRMVDGYVVAANDCHMFGTSEIV